MRWTESVSALILIAVLAGRVDAQPARPEPGPGPLAILDVPFISQSEALCGGAAAAMVLRYWGERGLTAESFAHLVDRSAAGIRTTTLLKELQARGWKAIALDGSDDAIEAELRQGRPVLTLIEDRPARYHYVVIVGTTADAIVFHDPARAPLRVVGRAEFSRRWRAANQWMALVLPGDRERAAEPAIIETPAGAAGSCDQLIASGVSQAQAGDLPAAERTLTAALSCGGAAAMRELAGVRVLQRRWPDVEALSATATALDAKDAYGWRLLGTSRFVQNNRSGALTAWNRVGEPRLDFVRVAGLERTRQRVVEDLIDARPGSIITSDFLLRSERRLRELPVASSGSLELVPTPGGLAEIRATIHERPVFPTDIWSYAATGALAASRRELRVGIASLTGGGERLRAEWRFWPGRPRIAVSLDAPAPWGGIWSAGGFGEHERFTDAAADAQRSGGFVEWSNWLNASTRVRVAGGVENWDDTKYLGRSTVDVRVLTRGSRFNLRGGGEFWRGAETFSRADVDVTAMSSSVRSGPVYVARAGGATGSARLPPLLWSAGDTGQTREPLLRAHPLVDDGRLRIEQMGRHLLNASVETQYWWAPGILRTAVAAFVDSVRTSGRLDRRPRGDVDAGLGVRLALPGTSGLIRADVATGLLHGGPRWTVVYEP